MKGIIVLACFVASLATQAQNTVGTTTTAVDGPVINTTRNSEPTLAYEFTDVNPFIESVILKLKEESFPDLMHYPNKAELVSKRKDWAIANPTYYQLFLWAKASVNGKIKITKAEYATLSPYLKGQVDENPNAFAIVE